MRKSGLFAALAAAAVVFTPATAYAQARPFTYPTATFKLSSAAIREPGTLSATVTVSTCVTALLGWADSDVIPFGFKDTVTGKPGRVQTLRFAFTAKDPAGEYSLDGLLGRECGHTGWTEIDPAASIYPSFKVKR